MSFEIVTPEGAEHADLDSVPDPSIIQTIDGVESPVELSKQDRMIKTKVDYYFDQKWDNKLRELRDKWKNILYGAGSTLLMVVSAYLGRVSA